MRRLVLGSLQLKNFAIVSPLEGVSDVGFRHLCAKNGAGITWTEMIRAQAINKNNGSTLDLIDTFDPETPTGIQLLVKSSDELLKCLNKLEYLANNVPERAHYKNIIAIDLNFGCPSPEIIKEGAGPSLLKRKKKLSEMFETLVKWKGNNSLGNVGAIGCKIRLGLNEMEQTNKVYINVLDAANNAGLDFMTVHARHAKQKSRDLPTWAAIGEIKTLATMPIIGNGDVKSFADAQSLMKQSKCDGVMIARGAIRNPWIFKDFEEKSADPISGTAEGPIWQEYWPTEAEVLSAQQTYTEMAQKYATKSKFTTFHMHNFDRLLKVARTGNRDIPVHNVKTIHML